MGTLCTGSSAVGRCFLHPGLALNKHMHFFFPPDHSGRRFFRASARLRLMSLMSTLIKRPNSLKPSGVLVKSKLTRAARASGGWMESHNGLYVRITEDPRGAAGAVSGLQLHRLCVGRTQHGCPKRCRLTRFCLGRLVGRVTILRKGQSTATLRSD